MTGQKIAQKHCVDAKLNDIVTKNLKSVVGKAGNIAGQGFVCILFYTS